VSASGAVDTYVYGGAGGSVFTSPAPYVASSWTRVLNENRLITTAASSQYAIGNYSGDGGTRGAADVLLWQADLQAGVECSPPIATAGTAATRVVSVPSMPAGTFTGATVSVAATWVTPSAFTAGATAFQLQKDATNDTKGYATSTGATSTFTCDFRIGGVSSTVATAGNLSASASNRVACYYDGANKAACLNGVCTSSATALTLPTGAMTMWVGTRSTTGNEARGTVKRVCFDGADARCR
jgi:hypothetical protein